MKIIAASLLAGPVALSSWLLVSIPEADSTPISDTEECQHLQNTASNFFARRDMKKWRKDTLYRIETSEISDDAKTFSKVLLVSALVSVSEEDARSRAQRLCFLLEPYKDEIFQR